MSVFKVFSATQDVNSVFILFLVICVSLLVLVTSFMLYFVFRYSRKRNTSSEDIAGNLFLEITWTVIPTILVLIMFYYGWAGFKSMQGTQKDVMSVKVTGRMWSWLFEYENGIKSDILSLPFGEPVKLTLISEDVIHSFFIPAFRVKMDAVPGMKTRLFFTPKELGNFDAFCAEYCGQGHSSMLAKVRVIKKEEFERWYEAKGTAEKGEEEKKAPDLKGAELVRLKGCIACHSIDGSMKVGPTFKGIFEREITVITSGKEREVIADEEYLRKSILEPASDLVKGYPPIMPPQGSMLSQEELSDIIEYLKKLK